MKDYYKILGVDRNAAISEIKKEFKRLLIIHHPDKGGDPEQMKIINEAYKVLSDHQKRKEYDDKWKLYSDAQEEEITGYLPTAGQHFSIQFKRQHQLLLDRFNKEPLKNGDPRLFFDLPKNVIDIFSNIRQKKGDSTFNQTWKVISPVLAISLFQEFLAEKYYGSTLLQINKILIQEIKIIKSTPGFSLREVALYEGIQEIFSMAMTYSPIGEKLVKAMQKITDYAKYSALEAVQNPKQIIVMSSLVPLICSDAFRNLFSFALHHYLIADDDVLDKDHLQLFNGCESVQGLIIKYKEKLEVDQSGKHAVKILRLLKLLLGLEKHLSKYPNSQTEDYAIFYREKGYQTLDWLPCLGGIVNQDIIINIFIQAAICFQKASRNETVPAKKMADEKLAYRLYLSAFRIGHKSNPDVALYTNLHVLKLISGFMYVDNEFEKVISELQELTAVPANMFPFYCGPQSNIALLEKEGEILILMRHLLHVLIDISEGPRSDPAKVLEHEYINVLHQAYTACLKNWYEEEYNQKIEDSIRLKLMQELLRINHWTFADVNRLLKPELTTTVERDSFNWLNPTRALSFSNRAGNYFTTINAVTINSKTGQVMMNCEKYDADNASTYSKLLSDADFRELFNNRTTDALFSLDPVDPKIEYHPFNKVRFAPSNLYQSQLLHTMFLADYLLKFLTVGREVQGAHPYAMRSLDEVIKILPLPLKKIIENFHAASSEGSTHRFWIESEEVSVTIDDSNREKSGDVSYTFGKARMVVKKHRMVANTKGELVDDEDVDEGWKIYVLSAKEVDKVIMGERVIESPAIVCVENKNGIFFVEDIGLSSPFVLKGNTHYLRKLYKLNREEDGKVVIKTNLEKSDVYTAIKEITTQAGKKLLFSPEYEFAQEFSRHYDAFAIYFPELARLRELSKAMTVTKLLEDERLQNQNNIKKIEEVLAHPSHAFWQKLRDDIKPPVEKNVRKNFETWRKHSSRKHIHENKKKYLDKLLTDIGTLSFTASSREVTQVIDENFERIKSDSIAKYGYAVWTLNASEVRKNLDSQANGLAVTLSESKFSNYLTQLLELFKDELARFNNNQAKEIVTNYLHKKYYNISLLDILVDYEEKQVLAQIQKIYSKNTTPMLSAALNKEEYSPVILQEIEEAVKANKIQLAEELKTLKKLHQTFIDMGFKPTQDIDLDKLCLWVPASIYRETDAKHARTVYGGVFLNSRMNVVSYHGFNGNSTSTFPGTTVHRVWGGDAREMGRSWTPVNPYSVNNYRSAAGLPNANDGSRIAQGTIYSTENMLIRSALKCDGNPGGLTEYVINNPKYSVFGVSSLYAKPPF